MLGVVNKSKQKGIIKMEEVINNTRSIIWADADVDGSAAVISAIISLCFPSASPQ